MAAPQNMNDSARMYLADAVDSSFRVVNRHQLFVWTQGTFQGIIPHEILICGIDDGSRHGTALYKFASTNEFNDAHFRTLCDSKEGLSSKLNAEYERSRKSIILCDVDQSNGCGPELTALLGESPLKNIAAYLVLDSRQKIQAFYAFSRVASEMDSTLKYGMELLVPHLHTTFMRVLATERDQTNYTPSRTGRIVTKREEQILYLLKEGKTNIEIAEQLDVSQWTIKNHLQMIFRKLNANTRTHAIAKAISLGLLKAD